MKKADQKLFLGIAIGATAAYFLLRRAMPENTPVVLPVRPNQGPALPQQIELPATTMTGTGIQKYTRRGRAMLAALHQYNYLKQPGYPMPGWLV